MFTKQYMQLVSTFVQWKYQENDIVHLGILFMPVSA